MPANYVLLGNITLSASTSSVTFSNIPQSGYTDLKIVISARFDTANTAIKTGFNGLTTNLTTRYLYGSGSAASSAAANEIYAYANSSSYTANTFGNSEIYIPNYTSSSAKSVSVDAVTENNATSADMLLAAGLWNNTASITSVTLVPISGNFVANSTFSLYGIAAVGTTPIIAPKATGGDTIVNDGTYWYHAFLSTGAFVPQTGLTADVLVIAGGGAGASDAGGGGGAGGLLAFTSQALTPISYTCQVGGGGVGQNANSNVRGGTGTDSQFGSLTLVKGGGGGGTSNALSPYTQAIGGDGGSGGGGAGRITLRAGGTATSGQGNNGGSGNTNEATYRSVGGGGGAGAAGQNGSNSAPDNAGAGGNGLSTYSSWGLATSTGQNVSGTVWYAGGGGGGNSGALASGGNGGGTASTQTVSPTNATANTGGGGGALSQFLAGGKAANGGSGIIIIRYPMA